MSDLTIQDVMDIAGLLHAKTDEAFKTLLAVKAEVPTTESDWVAFHEVRLEAARDKFDYWQAVKDRFVEANRETLNRGFGIV